MITRAKKARLTRLKISIDCYLHQTYPNKELIIVLNNMNDLEYKHALATISGYQEKGIRVFRVKAPISKLGDLRHFSIAKARGEIFCQWDDDDISHPTRLEIQFAVLEKMKLDAVFLREHMYLNATKNTLYLGSWNSFFMPFHPGTGMVRRSAEINYMTAEEFYPKKGLILGEDSLACFDMVLRQKRIGSIANFFHLFTYVYHKGNKTHGKHHEKLMERLKVSRKLNREQKIYIKYKFRQIAKIEHLILFL